MNMRVLKRSRKAPKAGDIFVFQLDVQPDKFWFGRVVSTDASVGGFHNTILIYIYNVNSPSKNDIPLLKPDKLLVPPMATNRLPWSRGYLETVDNRPLSQQDLLPAHHFKDIRGRYFDDKGNEVLNPISMAGVYGLDSYQTIDYYVSKALGIPPSPEI